MCLCVLTDNNREYIETRMSSEEFIMSKIEEERKKWKKEWTDMPKAVGQDGELIPSWETFKRKKQQGKICNVAVDYESVTSE